MNYISLIQRHGVLAALVIILAGLLAATNGDMLSRFESFKFGPVEAKLRALSLKGTTARDVETTEAGRLTLQKDTFGLWMKTWNTSRGTSGSELIERARVISRQRKDGSEPMLDAFDAFRREVVTPFAELDAALILRGIDLFDQPFSPGSTLHDAAIALDRNRPDSERVVALCQATTGLLRIVNGLPAWISDLPPADEGRCPSAGQTDALICAAVDSISAWNAKCPGNTTEELLMVADSPYAIVVVDTLIRRAIRDTPAAESFALVHYMNLLGSNKSMYPAIAYSSGSFDLVGKILVTALVHRATQGKIPPEETHAMLLAHYVEIESFVVSEFNAPDDRLKRYEPCNSDTIRGGSALIPAVTALNVCERLEYVTLPSVLNNLLFAIAEAWIQGRPVERPELTLSESLLGRAEARLDILGKTNTNAVLPHEVRSIYYGLLDTISLTRLMLAVEFHEIPSEAKCRSILAGFDDVVRYLRKSPTERMDTHAGNRFVVGDFAASETLRSVLRRQQIAKSYCGDV